MLAWLNRGLGKLKTFPLPDGVIRHGDQYQVKGQLTGQPYFLYPTESKIYVTLHDVSLCVLCLDKGGEYLSMHQGLITISTYIRRDEKSFLENAAPSDRRNSVLQRMWRDLGVLRWGDFSSAQ